MTDTSVPASDPNAEMPRPDARTELLARFGSLVLVMLTAERYRHLSVTDLEASAFVPLVNNQVAMAYVNVSRGSDAAGAPTGATNGDAEANRSDRNETNPAASSQLAGAAIWARVSDDVDEKIRAQIKEGVFPVRLKPQEWRSGDNIWLLDLIAPNAQIATTVLANLGKVMRSSADTSDGSVSSKINAHPIVRRIVDKKLSETTNNIPNEDVEISQ